MSSPTALHDDGGVQGLVMGPWMRRDGVGPVVGALKTKGTPSKHPRLLSLDCFRGQLAIAWMVVSDEAGDCFPFRRFFSRGCTVAGDGDKLHKLKGEVLKEF